MGRDLEQIADYVSTEGVERLCDQLAFELLYPIQWASVDGTHVTTIDDVMRLSHNYNISLSFFISRLNDAGLRTSLIKLTQCVDGGWVVTDSIAPPHGWRVGHLLSHQSSSILGSYAGSRFIVSTLAISTMSDPTRTMTVSMSHNGHNAIALRAKKVDAVDVT